MKSLTTRPYILPWLAIATFVSYLTLLCAMGFFKDWQELVTEPYFILRGLRNYTDISTHHAPLLTEFLAVVYRLFGTGMITRMALLILVSFLVALLTYRATKHLAGKSGGLFSLLLLTILWPFYGGTNFWFDSFLPLFYLLGFVLVVEKENPRWFILAGISLGLSFLVKQHGGVVALGIFVMLLLRPRSLRSRFRESSAFSLGVVIPIIIVALWYGVNGQLKDAFYWMVAYNFSPHYFELGRQAPPFIEVVRLLVIALPIVVFLTAALFSKVNRKLMSWDFLLVLVVGSCASLTIFPRWERWHVVPSVPFLVIGAVLSSTFLLRTMKEGTSRSRINLHVKTAFIIWALCIFLDVGTFYPPMLIEKVVPNFTHHWPLRSYSPPAWIDENFKRYLHDLPAVGKYLHKVTANTDRIFVWGWLGSRIYFEADRLPAGRFYYGLPWFTCLPRFKDDLLNGFEQYRPRYVVELKKLYPGTPSLGDLGINLQEWGYARLEDLQDMFPQIVIWRSPYPAVHAGKQ